jgi:hypothetical protein
VALHPFKGKNAPMKRAFLFGLGSFLILGIIALLVHHDFLSVITALVLMPVSVIAIIRKANSAPANYSRLRAVLGWFLGFLVVDAVIPAVVFVIWAVA